MRKVLYGMVLFVLLTFVMPVASAQSEAETLYPVTFIEVTGESQSVAASESATLCAHEQSRWIMLVESDILPNHFHLSTIQFFRHNTATCDFSYAIKNRFMTRDILANVEIVCKWYVEENKAECAETITDEMPTVKLYFHTVGQPIQLISTLVEDWRDGEYFSWRILGWTIFLPAIDKPN